MAGISSEAIAAGRADVAAAFDERLEDLCDAVVSTFQREIPEYKRAIEADASVLVEVRTASRLSLAVVIQALAEGIDIGPEASHAIGEVARRRSTQGIPLYAVQRAYQVGSRLGWEVALDIVRSLDFDPALAAEVVSQMSVAVMNLTEQLTAAVSSTLMEDAQS